MEYKRKSNKFNHDHVHSPSLTKWSKESSLTFTEFSFKPHSVGNPSIIIYPVPDMNNVTHYCYIGTCFEFTTLYCKCMDIFYFLVLNFD